MTIAQPNTESRCHLFHSGWHFESVPKTTSANGSLNPLPSCSSFPFPFPSFQLSQTLQHLELVIEAVDGAEAELPGLLVLVVEAVEAERGGDTIALGGE